MTNSASKEFPGGSRSRVNRAGSNVRDNVATPDDLSVIDEWRAAHRAVLNTFQAILRTRTRGTQVVVAQRYKRRTTIFDKLSRLPRMELGRMDDVAGCRLIFSSVDELNDFRATFHKARFNHKRKNDTDKYDYIKSPKKTGYRGIHDVYSYDVNSVAGQRYKGLLVEIQYRTRIQHAWATAVEVIGFVTENQPKFQQGDKRYENAMALASEILARNFEKSKGPYPALTDREVVEKFVEADKEIGLLRMLKGLNAAEATQSENRNTILLFAPSGELEARSYRDAPDALRALFKLELELPDWDVVLVRADTSHEIRVAFRNYFSDARDFIDLIEQACLSLSGRRSYRRKPRRKRR